MATRENLSNSLDAFGQVPGSILYRSPQGWIALKPGTPGQVLTISDQGLPQWQDAGGGGGAITSGAQVALSADQTVQTQSIFIPWDVAQWDIGGVADVPNNQLVTDKAGLWLITLSLWVRFAGNSDKLVRIVIKDQGTTLYPMLDVDRDVNWTQPTFNGSLIANLPASATIQAWFFVGGGTTFDIKQAGSYLTAVRLREPPP